jgi:hypothetical protein
MEKGIKKTLIIGSAFETSVDSLPKVKNEVNVSIIFEFARLDLSPFGC